MDVSTEKGIEEALKRIAENEVETFKSAELMTEDDILSECFMDECDELDNLSKDDLFSKTTKSAIS